MLTRSWKQVGAAAAAAPKGADCFDTNTPAEGSGDKQTPGARLLLIRGKTGQSHAGCSELGENVRTSIEVSRYPLPCSRKEKEKAGGRGSKRLYPGGERERERESIYI